ncbi:Peptidyl-prolyl cis-trans isomerase CWC27 -like protein [Channa argus]|uniref:Peptidyl-prolyl cis-trans isomerase CWC27-like protein n=1 Tax=Channa argus TaxID=215402 RepID=A0A6G1QGS2_CHAAH|nr:Peptidyl-prolyl cis-trans isomerase CWC27 -like protein [Channa argus]
MGHVLQFDEQSRKVKDANMQDEDTFEIYDPRNPVNKRRREESKKIMKEKKAKSPPRGEAFVREESFPRIILAKFLRPVPDAINTICHK